MIITVSAGWVWARHPVEPAEADIINGLANILINLIKPETEFTVSKSRKRLSTTK